MTIDYVTFRRIIYLSFCITTVLSLSACITYPDDQQIFDASSRTSKEAARIYLDMGLLRFSQQNMEEAEHYLIQAYQADQHAPKLATLESLALLYQFRGNFKQAEYWFKQALHMKPLNGRVQYNYGVLQYQMQHYQKAKDAFVVAMQDKNYAMDRSVIRQNIALCYRQMHDREATQSAEEKVKIFRKKNSKNQPSAR